MTLWRQALAVGGGIMLGIQIHRNWLDWRSWQATRKPRRKGTT